MALNMLWLYVAVVTQVVLMQFGFSAAKVESSDRCTIYRGDCVFHVVLAGSQCGASSNNPYHNHPLMDQPGYTIISQAHKKRELDAAEQNQIVTGDDGKSEEETIIPVKKLDEFEKKLTKMMEGLSIRSLRHIRQIKTDLRQVTNTMNLLKSKNRKKKGISCPSEFLGVGTWSSCYRFSSFNSTWHEAREYCSAFGANLVALDTLKEGYILDYLIKSNPAFEMPKGWWTSGNYIARSHKWMWTSKHHLKPINYSRWAPGEPNSRSTMHCMMLYKAAGYSWHDAMCTDHLNFICELELI